MPAIETPSLPSCPSSEPRPLVRSPTGPMSGDDAKALLQDDGTGEESELALGKQGVQ